MSEQTWVYIRTEPGVWTVGFFDPKEEWRVDADFPSQEDAAKRVHYLNGGTDDRYRVALNKAACWPENARRIAVAALNEGSE